MKEKDIMQIRDSITMPPETADSLLQNCTGSHRKHNRYSHYSRICAALITLFCIGAVSSTSLAAYNIYQEKQLAVFMDQNLTQAEIAAIGDELSQIPEISSHYISGADAWEEFKSKYFSDDPELEEMAASMDNPLTHSFNYRVSIRLGADTQAIRDEISQIDGVRKITTIRELGNELRN